jgi:hypothetical protein
MPPQQSVPVAQTSPVWMHHDEALHLPWEQSPEQQSAPVVQVLLSVLQVVVSGVQVPPGVQMPLQHSAFDVHAWVSGVHAGRLHTPLVHVPVQQSAGLLHIPPTWRQLAPPSFPKPVVVPVPVAPVPVPELVIVVPEAEWPPPPVMEVPLELPQPAATTPAAGRARTKKRSAR